MTHPAPQVGATLLRDRFFWLHKEKLMTPESYAEMYSWLGLYFYF